MNVAEDSVIGSKIELIQGVPDFGVKLVFILIHRQSQEAKNKSACIHFCSKIK